MHVISVNGWGIGAILIKLFTFSKWNHSAIMFDENTVFDVTVMSKVRCQTKEQFLKHYPKSDFHRVNVPNEQAALAFAKAQLGKEYDKSAIFGIIFQKRRWQEDDKWFCSELVEAILAAGGKIRFRTIVSSILPRETYAVI